MPRTLPVKPKAKAGAAFCFLFLYTVTVLVRPHEYSLETANYIFVKIFAIITFGFTLLSVRPMVVMPQILMLLMLTPLVVMSALWNGWGMQGVGEAQALFVSSIVPLFLYSVCITNISRQKLLMCICILAGLCMVYNGYLQHQSFNGEYGLGLGGSASVGGLEKRITYLGFFNDPNDLGMFLVMNLPILAYFAYKGGFVKRLVMLSIMALFLYGVYMTGSRGTILGVVGVFGAFLLFEYGGTRMILFTLPLAPVAATLLAAFGGLSASESSAGSRLEAWYVGVHLLIDNPIFGVGKSNYIEYAGKVAHNSYIHVASELGVFGYSLWGGALVTTMLASFLLMKKYSVWSDDDVSVENRKLYKEELVMNKTLFYSMVGFMITAFFLSRQFTLLMFIFLGMMSANHYRLACLRPEIKKLWNLKSVIQCMGLAWAIIVAVYVTLKIGL